MLDSTRDSLRNYLKTIRAMCSLLEKEIKFVFDEQHIRAFEALKKKLIETLILTSPN